MPKDNFIYKALTQTEFESFTQEGHFYGSTHDQRDGFIHLSTEQQLSRILAKYFPNETKVYILKVDINDYKHDIKWEPNSAGDLYPHLYNKPLAKETVVTIEEKTLNN